MCTFTPSRHRHGREHLDVVVVPHPAHDGILQLGYRIPQLHQRVFIEHQRDDFPARHHRRDARLVRQQRELAEVRAGAVTPEHPVGTHGVDAGVVATLRVALWVFIPLQRNRGAAKENVKLIPRVALPHDLRARRERHAVAPRRQRGPLVRIQRREQRDLRELTLEPQASPRGFDLVGTAGPSSRAASARIRRQLKRAAINHEAARGPARRHHRRRARFIHEQRLLAEVVPGAEARAGRQFGPPLRFNPARSNAGGRDLIVVDVWYRAAGPLPSLACHRLLVCTAAGTGHLPDERVQGLVTAADAPRGALKHEEHFLIVATAAPPDVALADDDVAPYESPGGHPARQDVPLRLGQPGEDRHTSQRLRVLHVYHPSFRAGDGFQNRKHQRVVRSGSEEMSPRAAVQRPWAFPQHDEPGGVHHVLVQVRLEVHVRAARVDGLHHRNRRRRGQNPANRAQRRRPGFE
mmetsp:Transcript_7894/g.21826  ORF Transcript_7894/g.21826 Transcript_7894/m.21826 type:complete len:464 (-) Transcript_7894:847-2238(-)